MNGKLLIFLRNHIGQSAQKRRKKKYYSMTYSTQREFRHIAEGLEKDMERKSAKIRNILMNHCTSVLLIRSKQKQDNCLVTAYLKILDKEVGHFTNLVLDYKDHCSLWASAMPNVGDDWNEHNG